MTIRQATERDIPRIGELLLQVCRVHHNGRPDLFLDGARKYDDDQLRALLRDETRPILVAVDENESVLGYAFCVIQQADSHPALTPVRTLYLDDLCVDEHCRGQHVGTALYDAVVALARARGCYNLTLHVWNCNPAAMRFYDARGLKCRQMELETIL